jgi:hypothetical protein
MVHTAITADNVHERVMEDLTRWPEVTVQAGDPRLDVYIPPTKNNGDCADFIMSACVHLTPNQEPIIDLDRTKGELWERAEHLKRLFGGADFLRGSKKTFPRITFQEELGKARLEELVECHEVFAALERERFEASHIPPQAFSYDAVLRGSIRTLALATTVIVFPLSRFAQNHTATHKTSSLWHVDSRELLSRLPVTSSASSQVDAA